jgi:uncharacterized protein YqgV (UPF0045/DUF77 family)
MKASFEMSLYPLKETFEEPVKDFIRRLRKSGFTVKETPLSTQVYGDYDRIMEWLQTNLKDIFGDNDHIVFTLKIVKGDRSGYRPFQD